jgi:chloramphenicol 3-O-phosphotransferase
MAIVKDVSEIRINSGNNFQIYLSTAWETLGNIASGKFSQKGSTVDGMFASGYKWKKRGSSEASFTVVLTQVTAEIYKRIMQLVGKTIKFYYDNGQNDNSEYMELFSNQAQIIEAIDIDMKGQAAQEIGLEIALNPSDETGGIMTCTPDTDLPDDAHATGASPVDSASPFIVMIDTTPV